MDINTDLAAIQLRIAQITGSSAFGPQPPPSPAGGGSATPFGAVLSATLAQQQQQELQQPQQAMLPPVQGAITSPFGERANPMAGGGGAEEFHPGVDIAAEEGTPIQAAMGGQVVAAGPQGGYGNLITVDNGNGITTRYAHCSEILARVGQTIAPGDIIGLVGSTGRATGPHLHFEVRENDRPVDPLPFLQPQTHV